MNNKVLKTLEFNKITEALSSQAYSAAARSRCRNLLPYDDTEEIRKAQEETTAAVSRIRKKHAPGFNPLKDITASIRRLEVGSALNCSELLEIAGVLDVTLSIKTFLAPGNSDEEPDALTYYYEELEPCTFLSSEIKRCILGPDEVADDASSTLKDIRRQKIITGNRVQKTLSGLISSPSMKTYLQDSIVTVREGRYCIPVKAEHKNHIAGMIHDESGSGATVFIEPMSVVKLNNELRELDIKEQEEIQKILEHLSAQCSMQSGILENDYKLLVQLDFIFAKGRYSEKIRGNEPEFNDNGFLELKQARHPLLERKTAVPINVSLGKDFSMLIVTGPNTGGKTVSLKTTGLLCLMGQSGLHIPAHTGSSLCMFKEVYADIGDEQSIEQSLSTFSSHMTNIVRILDSAGENSLILLDELCSGTDPTEGAALAQAILMRLLDTNCRVMATTHYSELKVFALSTPGVQNACCEFDVETLRPTYKLLIGLPGKSNAFAISQKLGLNEQIIDEAKERIGEQNIAFEDMLADIEKNRKTAGEERAKAHLALNEAEKIKKSLEKEKAALEAKHDKILEEAKEQAYELLSEAKDYADQTIKDIRKVSKDSNLSALERTRTEVGQKAKRAKEDISKKPVKTDLKGAPLTAKTALPGVRVKVLSLNMEGVISSGPDGRGKVNVQMGIFNKRVDLSDLETIPEESVYADYGTKPAKTGAGSLGYEKALGVSNEIKLLGMTVDDALIELDKYLDDAQVAHLGKVRIVHGKGTGALRSAVQHMLKRDKRVKSFRLAEYGEGDAGVTIAELK